MPIKAKPVDPERAKLAARGVWGRGQQETKTSLVKSRITDGGKSRCFSCASGSSSTTSSGSSASSCAIRGSRGKSFTDNKVRGKNVSSAVSRVFVLTNNEDDHSSEKYNSDPELYRAARERTARFLYPNGKCVDKGDVKTKNNNKLSNNSSSAVKEEDSFDVLANGANNKHFSTTFQSIAAETNISSTTQKREEQIEFRECMSNHTDDVVSPHISGSLRVVQEALHGTQETADSEIRNEFDRLMDLFAADIQKERSGVKQMSESDNEARRNLNVTNNGSSCSDSISTEAYGEELRTEALKLHRSSITFAELQEQTLLQLYTSNKAKDNEKCFIATEHMTEAFTLAALKAARIRLQKSDVAAGMPLTKFGSDSESISQINGSPLTLLEIVFAERARHNAEAALRQRLDGSGDVLPIDDTASPLLCCNADLLAAHAEASLNRFLLGVRCIESAICDRRVTDELGSFLFKHHKPFLETRSGSGKATDSTLREFSHEAYSVYEKYSTYVSTFITELLSRHVPNFNMQEFVLALYDVSHYGSNGDIGSGDYAVMDFLSYSAWRLLQSISSFDQFAVFMDDFIAEEYGVEQDTQHMNEKGNEGDDANVPGVNAGDFVVVAGARGIRALQKKTRAKAMEMTTLLGENLLQIPLSTFSNADGDDGSGKTNDIGNENTGDNNDCFLFGDTVDDKASSSVRECKQQDESHATDESCLRTKPPSALKGELRANVLSKQFRPPIMQKPTSMHSSGHEHVRCSSNSNSATSAFLHSTKGTRRPDAVPGRNLPPLANVVGKSRDGSVSTAFSDSTIALGSEASPQTVVSFDTFPLPGGVGAQKMARAQRVTGTSTSTILFPSFTAGTNRNQRSKSSSDKKSATVASEKRSNTVLRKKPANVTSQGVVNAELVVPHETLPIVASVWTNPMHVLVTDAEGEFIADAGGRNTTIKNGNVTSLAWHPTCPVLAIGWNTGLLMAWSLPPVSKATTHIISPQLPMSIEESYEKHDGGAVTFCAWSVGGAYLLTTSEKKCLVIWSVERNTTSMNKTENDDVTSMQKFFFVPSWSVTTEVNMTRVLSVAVSALSFQQQGKQLTHDARDDALLPESAAASNDAGDESDEYFFFLTSADKKIFVLNEEKKLFSILTLDAQPVELLYHAREHQLVVLSVTNIISVYTVANDFSIKLFVRRKLSMPSAATTTERFTPTMQWSAAGVLAFGCGDNRVRFFDILSDRVYFLPHPAVADAHITNISTLQRKGLLAMATAEGSLAIFQRYEGDPCGVNNSPATQDSYDITKGDSSNTNSANTFGTRKCRGGDKGCEDPAKQWELLTVLDLDVRVDCVYFTTAGHIVATLANGKMQILRETVRKRAWDGVVAATQISMDMVVVESVTGCQCLLKSDNKISGLSVAFPIIGLWDGQQIDLYTVNESTSTATKANVVPTTSSAFAIHREGIFFVRETNRIIFANFQLVTLGQISFTESEGTPKVINVMGDVVVAVSSTNAMRLAHVNGREIRQLGPPRQLIFNDKNVVVTDAKVNAQGRRVALMTQRVDCNQPDCHIWVYDCDTDQMSSYDFAARGEVPDVVYWNTPEPNSNTIGELGFLLLACETHQARDSHLRDLSVSGDITCEETGEEVFTHRNQQRSKSRSSLVLVGREDKENLGDVMPDLENFKDKEKRLEKERYMSGFSGINPFVHRIHSVVTLFATNKGLIVHNAVELKQYHICLVGLTIPDFLLASVRINGNPSNPEDYMIEQKRLRDFEGLKTERDAAVLEALMKFSYYYTIGNMDEAYRCVKTIKNPCVWQSLARMCVFTGRLDVAEVCLAQMQDGVAASALREARTNYPDEKNVHLATLACSLGLLKECEELLRKARRYDLCTDLLLACGKFEQARQHVKKYDRIHMYPVAYKYAQFMESFSKFETAVLWYSNAKCFSTDVARIFYQSDRLNELRDLVLLPPGDPNTEDVGLTANNTNGIKCSDKIDNANGDSKGEKPITTKVASQSAFEEIIVDRQSEKSSNFGGGHSNGISNDNRDNSDEICISFQRLFSNNKDLLLWWAQYSERRRQYSEALKFYTLADAIFDVVRLLCTEAPPRIEEAQELVDKEIEKARRRAEVINTTTAAAAATAAIVTGSTQTAAVEMDHVGAAFFIGLHYERINNVVTALRYYTYAGAWRAAAKVARKHKCYDDLLNISFSSLDTQLMLENAIFFEKNEIYEKAVELYHRVGDVQKAIDVCIKGGLYDKMHRISTTLDAYNNEEVFLQMAEHFMEGKHYSKAVEMYVFAKAFNNALELCTTRGVELTDDMANAMATEANKPSWTEEQRTALLRQIAGIAKDQGNWNLACKNYTQIGERVKAMKMLMRGGDVNKVIFFATHSRDAEIYTLAGNFLQSQNLCADTSIYKHIVLFYTKAKAFGNLISFVDAYAQLHIDENRNYYEAWCALDECVRLLERNRDAVYGGTTVMVKEESLRSRRDVVASFVRAMKLFSECAKDESKSEELIAVCSNLIKRSLSSHQDSHTITSAIRIGDVFALLVRYYYEKAKSAKDAMRVIESMVKHSVEPQFFLEKDLFEAICTANGRKVSEFIGNGAGGSDPSRGKTRGSLSIDETYV